MRPECWLVIATFTTGLIALAIAIYHEQLRTLFWKPSLSLELIAGPPCFSKTKIRNIRTNAVADCYKYRIKIFNNGNSSAENVEVLIEDIFIKYANEEFIKWHDFIPLNLMWSNILSHADPLKTIYFPNISPKTFKYCDLAHVTDPANQQAIDSNDIVLRQDKFRNKSILVLDFLFRPQQETYFFDRQGTYRLKIAVIASNAKKINKTIEIKFEAQWNENEEQMMRDNIGIKLI